MEVERSCVRRPRTSKCIQNNFGYRCHSDAFHRPQRRHSSAQIAAALTHVSQPSVRSQVGLPAVIHSDVLQRLQARHNSVCVLQQRKRKRSAMTHHPRALQHGQLEEHRDRPKSRLRPVIARAILEADRQPQNRARTACATAEPLARDFSCLKAFGGSFWTGL